MRIETNKKEAAQIVLNAIEQGTLAVQTSVREFVLENVYGSYDRSYMTSCGYYYKVTNAGESMCAIGHVFEAKLPKSANILENGPDPEYKVVDDLIDQGNLIVPEQEQDWFLVLQRRHDGFNASSRENIPKQFEEFIQMLKEALQ